MFDRLAEIEIKYGQLADQINDPDIIADQNQWRKLMKEYSDMTPIVEKYREYRAAKESIEESLMMLEEKGCYDNCEVGGASFPPVVCLTGYQGPFRFVRSHQNPNIQLACSLSALFPQPTSR